MQQLVAQIYKRDIFSNSPEISLYFLNSNSINTDQELYQVQILFNLLLIQKPQMCKQYMPRKPKSTKNKAQTKSQQLPISKDVVTGEQMRKKIFEKLRKGKRVSGYQKKSKRLSLSLCVNGKHQLKGFVNQQHLTCSICYDIILAPVLVQCGHAFCLSCIEQAYFLCQQCPLCRQQILDDSFSVSTQINKLVKNFSSKIMKDEQIIMYEQRQDTFKSNQLKRALTSKLEVGHYVDYNMNNKWREAKVEQIQKVALVLSIDDKNTKKSTTATVNSNSRRLAKHRTFTKAPPLKPIYFSKNFNFSEPVMQYIVEGPVYVVRRQVSRLQENIINQQEEVRNSWEQFQSIQNGNNWYLSENDEHVRPQSENIWNPSIEDDQQDIFAI